MTGAGIALVPRGALPVVAKLSRLRPWAIASRNQAGRGPRPPQTRSGPSLYLVLSEEAAERDGALGRGNRVDDDDEAEEPGK